MSEPFVESWNGGDQRIFAAMLDVKDAVGGFSFVVSSVGVVLDCMLVSSAKRECSLGLYVLSSWRLYSACCEHEDPAQITVSHATGINLSTS